MRSPFKTVAASSKRSTKSLLKLGIRLGVTGVLLAVVYRKADKVALLHTIESLSIPSVVLLAAIYAAGQALSAYRWSSFNSEVGLQRPYSTVLRAYFFGMLINIFGIGTVGGDVARSLALKPARGQRTAALAATVADRIFGLITLLFIGGVALLFVQPKALGWSAIPLSVALISGLGALWFIGPRLLVALIPEHSRFGEAARRAAQAFPRSPKLLLRLTGISIVFHLSQIYMHVLIAQMLGANIPLGFLLATVPLINTAASLPLSIQGIGVREGLYLMFFAEVGVPAEVTIAFGAVWILTVTLVSAIGGFLLPPVIEAPLTEEEQATAPAPTSQAVGESR